MGLSASQSRLLSLTSRMSDLELQAQTISNSKIRLSQESSQASKNYSAALDKQTLKVYSGLKSDGTSSYINATAFNLTNYNQISTSDKQRFIKDSAGKVVVTEAVAAAYNSNKSNLNGFLSALSKLQSTYGITGDTKSLTDYYTKLFNEIEESHGCNGQSYDNMKNSQWLSEQIQAGNLYLYEYDSEGGANGTGDYVGVSWTSGDNSLQFQSDDTDTAKAEADYEATMADIETKDKQFDLELQNINTEHTAVQTEVDSVKKIISKNIDRSFKIFDA